MNRIYPSVLASVLVMLAIGYFSFPDLTVKRLLGGEFIIAIMSYYVLLWLVKRFFTCHIPFVLSFVMVVTLVAYYFFPYKHETGVNGLYGIKTLFRWIPYFGIMLFGAYIGVAREKLKFNAFKDAFALLLCLVCFYAIQLLAKKFYAFAPFQIITIPFLFGIVYYLYKVCHAPIIKRIYLNCYGNWIIMTIGGLCLESYLIQYCVITDKLNKIFPLNMIVIFLGVFILSYIVRCIARIFSQTFRTEDYEWRKVFSFK